MPIIKADNRAVTIEYADEAGEITTRTVNVASFYRGKQHPFWYMDAYCQLRNDQRTFRTDRVLAVFDQKLCRIRSIDCASWLDLIIPELEKTSSLTEVEPVFSWISNESLDDIHEADSIFKEHFHALRALFYIAKADKSFRAAEKRLYQMFLTRVARQRMTNDLIRNRCIKLAMSIDTPTTGQFNYSVRKLQPCSRDYRMAVCATAKAMLNSDNTVVSYEQKLFNHLVSRLRPLEEH